MRDSCLHPHFLPGRFHFWSTGQLIVIGVVSGLLGGCGLPKPETLVSPTPLAGNGGKYLNPYLADGKLAPWADKGIHGNRFAAEAGAYVMQNLIDQVDVTGFAAAGAAAAIKQKGAIDASGGMEYMKSTSETSFDRREDFIVYLYVNHSTKEFYKEMLDLIKEVYPEVGWNYEQDIRNARKK